MMPNNVQVILTMYVHMSSMSCPDWASSYFQSNAEDSASGSLRIVDLTCYVDKGHGLRTTYDGFDSLTHS